MRSYLLRCFLLFAFLGAMGCTPEDKGPQDKPDPGVKLKEGIKAPKLPTPPADSKKGK